MFEITLKFVKETKNTFVYGTDEEGVALTSVYIQKSAVSGDRPKAIVVKVEAAS